LGLPRARVWTLVHFLHTAHKCSLSPPTVATGKPEFQIVLAQRPRNPHYRESGTVFCQLPNVLETFLKIWASELVRNFTADRGKVIEQFGQIKYEGHRRNFENKGTKFQIMLLKAEAKAEQGGQSSPARSRGPMGSKFPQTFRLTSRAVA
jgi:hypothetical protein